MALVFKTNFNIYLLLWVQIPFYPNVIFKIKYNFIINYRVVRKVFILYLKIHFYILIKYPLSFLFEMKLVIKAIAFKATETGSIPVEDRWLFLK